MDNNAHNNITRPAIVPAIRDRSPDAPMGRSGCCGGFFSLPSRKRGKRIMPASRSQDGSNASSRVWGPNDVPQAVASNQFASLSPSLLAPPSSPASFQNSAVQSSAQSPAAFPVSLCVPSANSQIPLETTSTMFQMGPYAHETALVSPPVFSTFTTAPSTAPFTPPPELAAHVTTPSSPDVPFAQLLANSFGFKGSVRQLPAPAYSASPFASPDVFAPDDLQAAYQLYPGSPLAHLLSPNSGTGASTPFPDLETSSHSIFPEFENPVQAVASMFFPGSPLLALEPATAMDVEPLVSQGLNSGGSLQEFRLVEPHDSIGSPLQLGYGSEYSNGNIEELPCSQHGQESKDGTSSCPSGYSEVDSGKLLETKDKSSILNGLQHELPSTPDEGRAKQPGLLVFLVSESLTSSHQNQERHSELYSIERKPTYYCIEAGVTTDKVYLHNAKLLEKIAESNDGSEEAVLECAINSLKADSNQEEYAESEAVMPSDIQMTSLDVMPLLENKHEDSMFRRENYSNLTVNSGSFYNVSENIEATDSSTAFNNLCERPLHSLVEVFQQPLSASKGEPHKIKNGIRNSDGPSSCCCRCGELASKCDELSIALREATEKLAGIEVKEKIASTREQKLKELVHWMQQGVKFEQRRGEKFQKNLACQDEAYQKFQIKQFSYIGNDPPSSCCFVTEIDSNNILHNRNEDVNCEEESSCSSHSFRLGAAKNFTSDLYSSEINSLLITLSATEEAR